MRTPNFRHLIDADLEHLRAGATAELNSRRTEREAQAYAKRVADAKRSDAELKALLAAKKRQELMDRALRHAGGLYPRDCYPYAPEYPYAPPKAVAEREPHRVSLSHWGLYAL